MTGDRAASGPSFTKLAWLAAAALLARWATFGNPIVHVDESFYLTVADAMARGAWPYVDIWDRKPIGLFLIYLPAALAPLKGAVVLYLLEALVAAVLTALLVAHIADRLGWRRGAFPAAIAYLFWLGLAGGQGGQAPVFFNALTAGAVTLILANPMRRFGRDALAMLLVGLALQVKYSVVFEGLFFGLVVAGRPSVGKWILRTATLALFALAPTIAAATVFAVAGKLDPFVFANFESVLLRPADPAAERFGRLLVIALILSPLAGMALAAARWHEVASERRFVFAWFAVALAGILVFGGWLDHYALPAMLPGAIAAAGFFNALAEQGRRKTIAAILAAALVAAQATTLDNRAGRGNARQFAVLRQAVADAPPGCLYVYSGPALLYPATRRCALSRFVFPNHLYKQAEAPAIGADQRAEVARILSARPPVIVMRPWTPGERRDIRAQVLAVAMRDYRPAARLPLGRERLMVLYRRDAR